MRLGKLPPELLSELLAEMPHDDPRVRLGPCVGEDAAAIAVDDGALIVTSDPVTFVSERAGWYAVHVNANDIAAMGGDPAWFSATVLAPPATEADELRRLFADLRAACAEVGAVLVTGHTEVTDAVTRLTVAGTMLGLAQPDAITSSAGAKPGDALLLAGPIALEGTAILAHEAGAALLRAGLAPKELDAAVRLLDDPGISVLPAARALRPFRPHALHDATEGGVATAVRELALASGVGAELNTRLLPILPLTARICVALHLNPLGLISSGCLVAAVAPTDVDTALAALRAAGLQARRAGRFTAAPELVLLDGAWPKAWPEFPRDELARFFEQQAGR
jgi:hydrogenase expression/formation protein HypE